MIFHTDAFYRRLQAEFYGENNAEIHNELLVDILPEALRQARKVFRNSDDAEDAAQSACLTFYRRGVHDYLKSDFADEETRKRWLTRTLKNAVFDHYRKVRSRSGVIVGKDDEGRNITELHRSMDAVNEDGMSFGSLIPGEELSPEDAFVQQSEAVEALRDLFAMENIGVSKLIVTAFAMLMQCYGYRVTEKKFNEYIARKINGQTIAFTLAQIRGLLKKMDLPLSVLRPLEMRIREVASDGRTVGEQLIDVTTRGVTQQTSDMRSRMRRLETEKETQAFSNVVAFPSSYRKE